MEPASLVPRIWKKDPSIWLRPGRDSDATARAIVNRLGWLDAPSGMSRHVERVNAMAQAAGQEGVRDVFLLGMGGSSLCAEVMRTWHPHAEGRPELHVLDTTDEQAITSVSERMDPERSWFVVASKSGGTVEVVSMARSVWSRMLGAL